VLRVPVSIRRCLNQGSASPRGLPTKQQRQWRCWWCCCCSGLGSPRSSPKRQWPKFRAPLQKRCSEGSQPRVTSLVPVRSATTLGGAAKLFVVVKERAWLAKRRSPEAVASTMNSKAPAPVWIQLVFDGPESHGPCQSSPMKAL